MNRIRHPASLLRRALLVVLVQFAPLLFAADESSPPPASAPSSSTPADQPSPPANSARQPEKTAPPRPVNRLSQETSAYLLKHAQNPVDWYPWGEEALARARREGKPIFLSIGYSSCHWCHVMERESFEDAEIAKILNEHFVCIKVDREERPDVDEIYMTSLQLYYQLAGSPQGGGWPLSMFLTPDARPIFGGTYFPPRDNTKGTGFLTVLGRVRDLWKADREKLQKSADQLAEYVAASFKERARKGLAGPLDASFADKVFEALSEEFDPQYGGFGYSATEMRRPKFPEPSNLDFLLAFAARTPPDQPAAKAAHAKESRQALEMVNSTLAAMAAGGIRDHVGGGLHRYSVDRAWQIPHFEKMLYDNGQLASVYSAAFAQSRDPEHRRVAEEILAFVKRDLTSPEGGFYASLDADSPGGEGAFYTWSKAEVDRVLSPADAKRFKEVYGLTGEPNFEGRYLPVLRSPRLPLALPSAADDSAAPLAQARQQLFRFRAQRPPPATDTKIITSWNGLMIRGFADAGRVFSDEQHVGAAATAADFVLKRLRTPDGRLLRTYSAGKARFNGYLEDYAYLVDGLIALHRATHDRRWLTHAQELTDMQLKLFWDDQEGGSFYTSHDHEALFARSKNPADSAIPSSNAVAAGNLFYLATALDRPDYRKRAAETLAVLAPLAEQAPSAVPRMASVLLQSDAPLGK